MVQLNAWKESQCEANPLRVEATKGRERERRERERERESTAAHAQATHIQQVTARIFSKGGGGDRAGGTLNEKHALDLVHVHRKAEAAMCTPPPPSHLAATGM